MQLGSKIQEQRKKRNLTQEKLASEMGVSVTAILKWEKQRGRIYSSRRCGFDQGYNCQYFDRKGM